MSALAEFQRQFAVSILLFLNVYLFILRGRAKEREREREREITVGGVGQTQKERESQAGSALSAQSRMQGLTLPSKRSLLEPKSGVKGLTDRATQAPCIEHFKVKAF